MKNRKQISEVYFSSVLQKNIEKIDYNQYYNRSLIYKKAFTALSKMHVMNNIPSVQRQEDQNILKSSIQRIEKKFNNRVIINKAAQQELFAEKIRIVSLPKKNIKFLNIRSCILFLLIALAILAIKFLFFSANFSYVDNSFKVVELKNERLLKSARIKGAGKILSLANVSNGIQYISQSQNENGTNSLIFVINDEVAQSIKQISEKALVLISIQKKIQPEVILEVIIYGLGKPKRKSFIISDQKQNEMFIVTNVGERKNKTKTVIVELKIISELQKKFNEHIMNITKVTFSKL